MKKRQNTPQPVQAKSMPGSPIQRKAMPPQFAPGASTVQRSAGNDKNPKIMPDHGHVTYQDQPGPVSIQGAGDSHAIAYNDVRQGAIADCYFLSSLAGVAKTNPELLANNIDGPKSDGTYNVRLYRKKMFGGFDSVIYNVTSEFPADATGHRMYSQGEDTNAAGEREIWVSLIQKAYAQMLGSYENLAWGFSQDAFEALTGQEFSSHSNRGLLGGPSSGDIAADVLAALRAGKPVTAQTGGDGSFNSMSQEDKTFAQNNRIVARHVYTVLNGDANNVRVRNPWGGNSEEVVMTWAQFKTYFKEFTTRD